tara:strand:- start:5668 stop:6120 length:453 start_codon:yes stop_codon:yes gene_type:complete
MTQGKLFGVKKLTQQLISTKTNNAKALRRGLYKAGLQLQRESMKIVPIQTGHLRASAFTRNVGSDSRPVVHVGYTAKYALFVHEIVDNAHGADFNKKHAGKIAKAKGKARKVWFNRGINQQAKFLEKPLRDHHVRLVTIVLREVEKGRLE